MMHGQKNIKLNMKELGEDSISGKRATADSRIFCLKIKINNKGILAAVLCGCETWSLILREEHTLRVFENGLLRKIFKPKRGRVAENWCEIA